MNDNIFHINFKKLAVWWLMTGLRKAVLQSFIFALIIPLELFYIEVLKARKQNLIRMNHNYQKFSVQQRLNNAFDPIESRIKIVNSVQYDGVYLYTEAEDDAAYTKTRWLSDNPLYLRTESELTSEFDFIVEIPNTNINLYQLRAEIDFYILPSKRYEIVII